MKQFTSASIYLQKPIFYLIILFLPTQLGKHFWPDFSYISGLRIDYLSPTIYFTDVLIFILFLLVVIEKLYIKKQKKIFPNIKNYKPLFFLILVLAIGIFFSKSPFAGIYGILKFFEFLFFFFYVKNHTKNITIFLALGVLLESALVFLQLFNKGSINGIFYFFGERFFTSQTPGIANASLDGDLILRPYGTFSHPNVLAGYLLIAMTIIIYHLRFAIYNFKKYFFTLSLFVGSIALFLTMSRVAIALWIISLFIKGIKFKILIAVFIFLIFIFSPLKFRFLDFTFNDRSYIERADLMVSSFKMIGEHPFFGVGLNNFLQNLTYFSQKNYESLFFVFQPVHNIYLLLLSQTGILGFIFFLLLIFKTIKKINKQNNNTRYLLFTILFSFLLLGFFDHYFLTLQQGQLLFALVMGMCWAEKSDIIKT